MNFNKTLWLLRHSAPSLLLFSFIATANNDLTDSTEKKLEEILKLTESVINNSVKQSDYLLFQSGIEAKLALDSWKRLNSDQLDTGFQKLNENGQRFLFVLDDTMRITSGSVGKNFTDSHRMAKKIEQFLNKEKPWNSGPAVLKISPAALYFDDKNETVPIKLHGENLNFENAMIEIGSQKFKAVETKPQSILFQLPLSLFKFNDYKSSVLKAAFTAAVKPNWFSSFYRENEIYTVPLEFLLLPKKMAEFRIDYATQIITRTKYSMTENIQFSDSTPGWSCKDFNFKPSEGRTIDIDSVKTMQKNAREGKFRVVRIKEQEIKLELCAKRWSDLNNAQISKGPGNIDIELEWNEYRTEESHRTGMKKGQLGWNEDYSINLPANTRNIFVQTTLFNGQKDTAKKSGELNEFLLLHYDPKQQHLFLEQNIPPQLSYN